MWSICCFYIPGSFMVSNLGWVIYLFFWFEICFNGEITQWSQGQQIFPVIMIFSIVFHLIIWPKKKQQCVSLCSCEYYFTFISVHRRDVSYSGCSGYLHNLTYKPHLCFLHVISNQLYTNYFWGKSKMRNFRILCFIWGEYTILWWIQAWH